MKDSVQRTFETVKNCSQGSTLPKCTKYTRRRRLSFGERWEKQTFFGRAESKPLATVHRCMPPDVECMIETCCGNNIGRGEEELLR
jgi:hypothetical protein